MCRALRWPRYGKGSAVATDREVTEKKTFRAVINSDQALYEAISAISRRYHESKYLVLSGRVGKDRSVEQNRLWHAMYKRVSMSTGQGTPEDVWAYCKLMIGVPILRRDDERFANGFDRYFGGRSFEEQLFLMGKNNLFGPNGFPVTSLFGTSQGSEYTNAIADHYAEQGVDFSDILEEA